MAAYTIYAEGWKGLEGRWDWVKGVPRFNSILEANEWSSRHLDELAEHQGLQMGLTWEVMPIWRLNPEFRGESYTGTEGFD